MLGLQPPRRGLRPPTLDKRRARAIWDAASGPTNTFHLQYDKENPQLRGLALGYMERKKWYKYACTPAGRVLLGVDCSGHSSAGGRKQDRVRKLLEHLFALFVECSCACSWWHGDVSRVAERRDLARGSFCLYTGFVNALLNVDYRQKYYAILLEAQRDEDEENEARRPPPMDEPPTKKLKTAPAPAAAPAPAVGQKRPIEDLEPLSPSDTDDTDDDPTPTGGPSAAPEPMPVPAPAPAPAPAPIWSSKAKAPRAPNPTLYEKRVPAMEAQFRQAPDVLHLMLLEFVRCKAEASAKRLVYNAGNRAFTAEYENFSFVSKRRNTIHLGSTEWDAYVELRGSFKQRLSAMERGRNRAVLRSEADIKRFFKTHPDLNYPASETNTR
jgi:hypothetical protein